MTATRRSPPRSSKRSTSGLALVRALAEASRAVTLAAGENPRAVLEELVRQAEALLGCDAASIHLLEEGLGPPRLRRAKISRFAAERGLAEGSTWWPPADVWRQIEQGLVVFHERFGPGRSADVEQHPWLREIASALYAPLVTGQRAIGLLFAAWLRPRRPDAETLLTAELLGRQAADAVVTARLVQEATRARAEAEAAQRQLAAILSGVDDGLIAQDAAGRLVFASEAAARILGFGTAAELLAAPLADVLSRVELFDEAGQPFELDRLPGRRLLRGEPATEALVGFRWRGEARVRWAVVRATSICDAADRVERAISIFRDVTDQRRAGEAQRFLTEASMVLASSLDYETTLGSVVRLVVPRLADWCTVNLLQADGSIRRVAMVHADPAKTELAWELERRFPHDPEGTHGVPQVIRTGQSELVSAAEPGAFTRVDASEEQTSILDRLGLRSLVCAPLTVSGRTIGAIAMASGVPGRHVQEDLVLLEEVARRAAVAIDNARLYREAQDAIRARDEFLSIASHELRTPVTTIKGAAQLLLRMEGRGADESHRRRRTIDFLQHGTDRLAALTSDLLDVSQIRLGRLPLRRQSIELASLVREVAGRYEETLPPGLSLRLDLVEPCVIMADRDRLEQVLTNLLDNATKYSPSGGVIDIILSADADGALLMVRDRGIGVPREALESIFQPFGRAENAAARAVPGMGLGLHICRNVVERHGGRIWAESAGPDTGTTFWVRLPAAAPAQSNAS